ncbi:bifunctional heptose 7-phosphate kinase/heptose 1-phosphate adenyltransferase [Rhodopila sp.]|jgi:D-beta-D-heptose 7-phosphate kinase/D-beta-D-heptose 1-phosphate adenosyltransferase|uniref:bifunctional heptose 7-phosphate kinase/heptose 1-phosphate adenyltransferase n=1 Tax=Rhodopila sp. TaxID=2480087 RepID=UPI002CAA97FB|nr:bifunctional heptose 7-phosphate kinase/heptose 1-phosphate adenyltransferase [Rhodopila sp.]HVZ08168.1 bifunctional heptose 7-phosphate kinase/heptose 1-phosphate adenyltransferase [Rhodopila sp.]
MNQITPGTGPRTDETQPDLAAAVRRLSHTNVLVIGDVMLDRYTYGEVTRISQEAPVPILAIDREVALPGGAGNVVRNLTALGAATAFISVVGDDQAGSDLTGLIGGQPNVEPWLLVQGGRTTTLKTRLIASGQQLLRADREQTDPIHPKLADRMLRIALDAMAATTVTILSDYGKGVLAADVPPRLVEAARKAGRKLIVDPRGSDFARYAGADIVMPNRQELAAASRMPVDSEAAIVAAAQHLRVAHGFGAVVVTRGNDGMTLVEASRVTHFPAEAADVYDVSGAGDTALAALGAALAANLELPVAVRLANLAAGISVGKVGPSVVRESDLLSALSPQNSALRKIVTRDEAVEQAERWRHRGWRVGFTNGFFDLLHQGHIHLLEEARARCDRLVVGLNSDASVRRLRGLPHPVQPEAARAAVLAGFACVDEVCLFDEDSPEALIEALRPDVLIKGGKQSIEEVEGADLVRSWGGRVQLVDWIADHLPPADLTPVKA